MLGPLDEGKKNWIDLVRLEESNEIICNCIVDLFCARKTANYLSHNHCGEERCAYDIRSQMAPGWQRASS